MRSPAPTNPTKRFRPACQYRNHLRGRPITLPSDVVSRACLSDNSEVLGSDWQCGHPRGRLHNVRRPSRGISLRSTSLPAGGLSPRRAWLLRREERASPFPEGIRRRGNTPWTLGSSQHPADWRWRPPGFQCHMNVCVSACPQISRLHNVPSGVRQEMTSVRPLAGHQALATSRDPSRRLPQSIRL